MHDLVRGAIFFRSLDILLLALCKVQKKFRRIFRGPFAISREIFFNFGGDLTDYSLKQTFDYGIIYKNQLKESAPFHPNNLLFVFFKESHH